MNQKFVKGFARVLAFILAIIMIVSTFIMIPFAGEAASSDYIVYGAEAGSADDTLSTNDFKQLEAYIKFLHENFKDKVDYETLVDGAFDGVTKALGDRFSEYFPEEEDKEEFTSSVEGVFVGVGVSIVMRSDGKCVVDSPLGGSPAQKAGIQAGDIITAVDGRSTEGLTLAEVSSRLRGEKGTTVNVTVLRDNTSMDFSIVRDTINENCLTYRTFEGNIGYIAMTGFDSDAATEFKLAKVALIEAGAETIILDLRGNPGGYVEQAISIAEQILESGDISHFESRGRIIKTHSATKADKVSQPIVLLVDGNTASASEILAGALQDNDAATVVGTTTYGKGVAQNIITIGDEKSAKISTFYFLTPDKNRIQDAGIKPDIVVENMTMAELASAKAMYEAFAPMSEKEKPGLGAVGLNVYGAQQRLAMLGYDVEVTGTMDADTVQAVKEFQKASGLYAYGVLDYTTAGRLDEAALAYANGQSATDVQLEKAMEIARTL